MNHKYRVAIPVLIVVCVGLFSLLAYRIYRSQITPSTEVRPATEQTSKPEPTPTPTSKTGSLTTYKDFMKNVVVSQIENRLSPYTETFLVNGEARGTWFFEGTFPVELQDANGKILVTQQAPAKGEWMTEEFVPFTFTINYSPPTTKTGFLFLKKDNPSGDPSRDDAFKIPVTFPTVQ